MEFKYTYNKPTNYTSAGSIVNQEQIIDGANKTNSNNNNDINNNPKLFSQLKIKNMKLKNRIVVSPMCQYSSNDGHFNDWHFSHYSNFAKGGASLVFIEATSVLPEGRITYGDAGLWKDSQIDGLKRIVDFSHEFDTKIGIQLGHAGRKGSSIPLFLEGARNSNSIPSNDPSGNGWNVYAPSSIAWSDKMSIPIEMTIKDIENVIESFKNAAIRSIKAGIDFIEIHGAHGYLINQFLSSTSNKRTDSYGGSFNGRIKLLVEIIKAVRSVWSSDKPLGVRISVEEWVENENGWNLEESIKLSEILESLDVDLIDVTTGGNNSQQKITSKPLYQVPFAQEIKQSILKRSGKLLVSSVGLITTANEAESILQSNSSDLILFGRAFLRNPFLPIEFAHQLKLRIDYTLQYQPSRIRYTN
ncbi:hypothetical protein RB653_004725 [Dictyostelium firmibasis]|uniref:NADH:flavin oxidoreductase/NADH oxidase N-terminal domain-containing protein n=1 Tax=Dictyostelium firmibasis TaxID=79012 RepID=A0AAN7U887_9MYCE